MAWLRGLWRRFVERPSPRSTTLLYVLLAGAWIVFSDALLFNIDVDSSLGLSVAKGLGFVAITGAILYSLLRHTRQAVERQETQLRFQGALLDQVRNAVIATDLEGSVTYWNRAAEDLYGWASEEAVGRPITELTVPAPARAEASEIMVAIASEGAWQDAFEVTRKDGSTFPALVSNARYHGADGAPAGIVGVSTDLTPLYEATQQAAEAGNRARAVLDSVHFPVVVVDAAGRIIDVNDAWVSFGEDSGGDVEQMGVGNDYVAALRTALVPASDLDGVFAGISGVLRGDAPLFTHLYAGHTDDELRWYEMQVTAIEAGGAVIAHVDLTTEMLAQRALERTVEEKDEFLATISHELRTPLTAVLGFAEQLESGQAEADELQHHYELIADQARELADLVEDLLVAGRLDADAITIRPEPVVASELIMGVLRPWEGRLPAPSDSGRVVYADPLRTRQVLRNLVANSFRHGAEPRTIEVTGDEDSTSIHVRDGGPGVADEALAMMWGPYSAASKGAGQPGSVGLGLHVSRRLAELMGGTLSYSREGSTTVFTLTLPASGGNGAE